MLLRQWLWPHALTAHESYSFVNFFYHGLLNSLASREWRFRYRAWLCNFANANILLLWWRWRLLLVLIEVCGAGSMKRSCVRPSVRLSVCLPHYATAAAACGGFAAERRAGGRYRSTAAAPDAEDAGRPPATRAAATANASSATFTTDAGSWTQTDYYYLANSFARHVVGKRCTNRRSRSSR